MVAAGWYIVFESLFRLPTGTNNKGLYRVRGRFRCVMDGCQIFLFKMHNT